MTFERFMELVEANGADPARWPEAERAAAVAIIEADPRARAALADAMALDAALDSYVFDTAASSARVRAAIEEELDDLPAPGRVAFLAAWSSWQRAAALAAVLMFGVASGAVTSAVSPAAAGEADVIRLAIEAGPFESMEL